MLENSKHKSKLLVQDLLKNIVTKTRVKSENCRVFKIRYKHRSKTRLILLVRCYEDYSNPRGHLVSLALDLKKEKHRKLASKRVAVLTIPMKVFCNCPAYLYWGSKYIATRDAYNINTKGKEIRPAKVRDPKGNNIICKHIAATATALKSQSVYKAFKGKMKSTQYIQPINISDNILEEEAKSFPEISIIELEQVLKSQGIYFKEELTEENFETSINKYFEREGLSDE